MCCVHEYRANRYVFSKRLKESVLIDGSLMKSVRLFQTVGPATAKARPP